MRSMCRVEDPVTATAIRQARSRIDPAFTDSPQFMSPELSAARDAAGQREDALFAEDGYDPAICLIRTGSNIDPRMRRELTTPAAQPRDPGRNLPRVSASVVT